MKENNRLLLLFGEADRVSGTARLLGKIGKDCVAMFDHIPVALQKTAVVIGFGENGLAIAPLQKFAVIGYSRGKTLFVTSIRDARLNRKAVFMFKVDQTFKSALVEPEGHTAQKCAAVVLNQCLQSVAEEGVIEIVWKISVSREGASPNISGIIAHKIGSLLSFPRPRGYFPGVGFRFLMVIRRRLP